MYMDQENCPFYIGKGYGRRWYPSMHKSEHTFNKIKSIGVKNVKVHFLHKDISEEEAFSWERYWIKYFGRIDNGTGQLTNHTDGGEGISGHKHTEETKRKIGKANKGKSMPKGKDSPFYGKNLSDGHKRKLSEAKEGQPSPRKGVKLSDAVKQKISDTLKRNWKNQWSI